MEKKYDINQLYENHIGLIKSRVNKFSKKYKMDYEELYLEANLFFTELFYKRKYDETKGKFSTYFVKSLDKYLLDKFNENKILNNRELNFGDLYEAVFDSPRNATGYTYNHADSIIEKISLQQKIDSLSSTDKEVVKVAMTLKNPESKWAKSRNISKNAIKKYLIELGWRAVDVKRSFNRIELALFG